MNPSNDDKNRPALPGSPGRRRLIRLGASVAPVAMTLASRPAWALANGCNTTSAWGSAQLAGAISSVQARASSAQLSNKAWGVNDLIQDRALGGVGGGQTPWYVIYQARYGSTRTGSSTGDAYAQATLKVSDLFPMGLFGYSPVMLANAKAPDSSVFTYLKANPSTSNFATALLAARINALYGGANAGICLSNGKGEDILADMARGVFTPSNGTAYWSNTEVLMYLVGNGIVTA